MEQGEPFRIAGAEVPAGERRTVDLSVTRLYTHSAITMPVHVIHGARPGPRLFVSAAMHGDEINGVEIIRRLIRLPLLRKLCGTLIAVPVVNVHGFIHLSRYLPDRRDLNRTFPGSPEGSLTARLAHLFLKDILDNATHGIDLHTGALHRSNLPQIRGRFDDAETLRLATAFGAPVLVNAELRGGSLREIAAGRGIPVLIYEGGEALRFDEHSIRVGLRGILAVMRALDMIPPAKRRPSPAGAMQVHSTVWVRAPDSGILRAIQALGRRVAAGDILGTISDPFGERDVAVTAPAGGVIIGRLNLPLVNEGDALFNIARLDDGRKAAEDAGAAGNESQEIEADVTGESLLT
jgi:predicted deacylase